MARACPPREAQPTPAQYAQAFDVLRRRPRCPRTVEAALAHPVYGLCLRALAKKLACEQRPAAPPRSASPARRTVLPFPPRRAAPAHTFDARKAAANDKDDDDAPRHG